MWIEHEVILDAFELPELLGALLDVLTLPSYA